MKEFKNIIFDLGGVILDIDYKKTIEAFRNLSIQNAGELYAKSSQIKLFDDLEMGNISEDDFYSGIRKLSEYRLNDEQIRDAWNALLIGLPEENVKLLTELKKDHRLFLLSNTNCIHENAYRQMVVSQYGRFVFDELFEKMYLSHYLHLRKPDPSIFHYVLADSKLNITETCFIDDSPQHVEAASKAGITSFLLKEQSLVSFFSSTLNIQN
jgi:glucose-1-phosphatase